MKSNYLLFHTIWQKIHTHVRYSPQIAKWEPDSVQRQSLQRGPYWFTQGSVWFYAQWQFSTHAVLRQWNLYIYPSNSSISSALWSALNLCLWRGVINFLLPMARWTLNNTASPGDKSWYRIFSWTRGHVWAFCNISVLSLSISNTMSTFLQRDLRHNSRYCSYFDGGWRANKKML